MATARITQAAPPNVDPIKATLAFGDRAIPRLVRELKSSELLTVQRALMALCDMLRNPQHVRTSLDQGITRCLLALLVHGDPVVRQKATEALLHYAGHSVGRDAIIKQKLAMPLSKLFNDDVDIVRLNVQATLELVSTQRSGASQLVDFDLVPVLLSALQAEVEPEIQNKLLQTLYNTMKVNTKVLLDNKAMKVFIDLISSTSDVDIRKNSATNIMSLSFPAEGKVQACDDDAITPLVYMLEQLRPPTATDPSDWFGVAAAAAGALMSITVTTQGKKMAIKAGALDSLPSLLEVPDERVVLNGIKLITTLAEHPMGRAGLQKLVPKLTALKSYSGGRLDHMAVPRNAQTAIDTIVWKP